MGAQGNCHYRPWMCTGIPWREPCPGPWWWFQSHLWRGGISGWRSEGDCDGRQGADARWDICGVWHWDNGIFAGNQPHYRNRCGKGGKRTDCGPVFYLCKSWGAHSVWDWKTYQHQWQHGDWRGDDRDGAAEVFGVCGRCSPCRAQCGVWCRLYQGECEAAEHFCRFYVCWHSCNCEDAADRAGKVYTRCGCQDVKDIPWKPP